MTINEAIVLATSLLTTWGLTIKGWTVGFNHRKRAMGVCRFKSKRIELSRHFVAMNDEHRVKQTILHEIAHALAGAEAGHGILWQVMARKVGCPPTRCSDAEMPAGKWKATCNGCGRTHSMFRKPKRRYRCKCGLNREWLTWANIDAIERVS